MSTLLYMLPFTVTSSNWNMDTTSGRGSTKSILLTVPIYKSRSEHFNVTIDALTAVVSINTAV